MAVQNYEVVYRNGRSRIVPADGYTRHGTIYTFSRDGADILTIEASEVESVGLAELPKSAMRAPRIGAV